MRPGSGTLPSSVRREEEKQRGSIVVAQQTVICSLGADCRVGGLLLHSARPDFACARYGGISRFPAASFRLHSEARTSRPAVELPRAGAAKEATGLHLAFSDARAG